jgi:hypothetical protein
MRYRVRSTEIQIFSYLIIKLNIIPNKSVIQQSRKPPNIGEAWPKNRGRAPALTAGPGRKRDVRFRSGYSDELPISPTRSGRTYDSEPDPDPSRRNSGPVPLAHCVSSTRRTGLHRSAGDPHCRRCPPALPRLTCTEVSTTACAFPSLKAAWHPESGSPPPAPSQSSSASPAAP